MYSKSLLIAIAAFAVTASGAQAFMGPVNLERAGLTRNQVEAFSQARDLRAKGKVDEARDLLLEAGVDEETLKSLRKARHEARHALHTAVEQNDFAAFKLAVEGTPLVDIITTEDDFAQFVKAHELRAEKKFAEAEGIMDELGLPDFGMRHEGKRGMFKHREELEALTVEQKDALRAARQANDQETISEILKEAGIDTPVFHARHSKDGR